MRLSCLCALGGVPQIALTINKEIERGPGCVASSDQVGAAGAGQGAGWGVPRFCGSYWWCLLCDAGCW